MKSRLIKKTNYHDFFNGYRITPIKSDGDLINQVGWSVQNEPLDKKLILEIVDKISNKLELSGNDRVLDLCCGNGLLTFELVSKVYSITGIDFSKAYIDNAIKYKQHPNISYHLGSVTNYKDLLSSSRISDLKSGNLKILMSNSLGYFDKESLVSLLSNLDNSFDHFKFYLTGIPNYEEHKIVFPKLKDQIIFQLKDRLLQKTKGIGHFWKERELAAIVNKFGFLSEFDFDFKIIPGQSYRFNMLIVKP
jgi:SAM-dependent methyltransferase